MKELYILIPDIQGKILVDALVGFTAVAEHLNRTPKLIISSCSSICKARTDLVKRCSANKALMLDSDIVILNPKETAEAILNAESQERDIVARYNSPWGNGLTNFLFKGDGVDGNLTDAELDKSRYVKWAGLGFYYGRVPQNYVFNEGVNGEDHNFFIDNGIVPYYDATIKLLHKKTVYI